jgi:hypothetical protein
MFKGVIVGRLFQDRKRREDMLALSLAMKIRSDEYDSLSLGFEDNDKVRKIVKLVTASGEVC